ncbi:glycosyltransferase family 2 protein [Blautia liquoris]|uniref:Glycosyltransferase family 2 protein n=1 Tax=Blautia liquoris TaxID=2779518 RepID=A0A7M2RJ57_9FIRM|nr:glycosyltransferase family 2 protein [Blautia liquoris]QOV20101.1 glycosyltransferase family 2 protein [Blautia liquoris]
MNLSKMLYFIKKLKPYNIVKGLRYLNHYGPKEFFNRLFERLEPDEVPYGPWYESHRATPEELKRQSRHTFAYAPLISVVVPAYHTPEAFLREMIESVKSQSYENWQLVIADASPDDERMNQVLKVYADDDRRIVVRTLKENLGIAENTNAGFSAAAGDYVGLLDHDDLLAPDALYEVVDLLNKDRHTDVVYTDEDKVTTDLSEHFQPHMKPDFNLDLLRSNNYICHFFVVKRSLIERVGGFRREFDGAQDYDFIFRCVEQAKKIGHIPRILYHWRTHKTSTADNPASKMYAFEAGKRAIEGNLMRMGVTGACVSHTSDYGFYNVTYPVKGSPLISIIIPNKDHIDLLKQCIDSVTELSTYQNYELLIVENNSKEPSTFEYYQELEKRSKVRVITYQGEFNFSAINNFAVSRAKGDFLIFLNNDIKVITPGWMESLLANVQRPEVGVVGSKLYYPDDTIQHAGIIIGIGGIAGHAFLGMKRSRTGYLHKASLQMDYSAVTAACMMMKREVFDQVEGFDEKLKVAFNDVDLCLRVCQEGYLCVYDPHVEMYHYESKSRGLEDSKEKVRRFQTEIEYMRTRWIDLLKKGDPYYNKNLTLGKWNYSLRP